MGFLTVSGSSCFLQTPISHSLPVSTSSQSLLLCDSHIKNANNKRKHRPIVTASSRQGTTNEADFCKRRAIVVLGFSALPFLQLKATAFESFVQEKQDTRTTEESQRAELPSRGEAPLNPILSLLNVVGVIGSGVIGALYTLAQKEKTAAEGTVESLTNRLVENDAALASLEKNFEKRLLNEQEEKTRQNQKAKEEKHAISNQLTMANSTIAGLGKELQNERKKVEELKSNIGKLENGLMKAEEDNKMLDERLKENLHLIEALEDRINLLTLEVKDKDSKVQSLSSLLSQKESECDNLIIINKRAKEDLSEANSQIEYLKEELLKTQEHLNSKTSTVDDLNSRVTSFTSERDDTTRKVETLQEVYNALRSSSEKKAASDAELLEKKEHELHQVEEKLKLALNEVTSNQNSIVHLTQERDGLKNLLELKVNNVKNLQNELQITKETLQTSRNEVANVQEQLGKSRMTCEELASEISRAQGEFIEVRESLTSSLEEARSNSKTLSEELTSVRKDLETDRGKFQTVSDELQEVTETRDRLKKELLEVYKKAESASHALKEEKKAVVALQKQLEGSEKQIREDKEARKSLETDLEDATKSLDEVNKNIVMLSRELDIANSRVENLEAEKDVLYNSLTEQKNLSNEARENIEDAHDIIMKLGKERDSLDKRGKKLEEELAAAKGEILRLRSERSSSKSSANDTPRKRSSKAENDGVVSVKKVGRRRKNSDSSSETP